MAKRTPGAVRSPPSRSKTPRSQGGSGAGTTRYGGDAQLAVLRAFGGVAEALGEAKDLDALLHLIAMQICELAGVQRCSVYLRDEATGLFRGQVGHPDCVGDERIKRLVAGMAADRFTQEIVESMRPVALVNALDDPRPVHSTMCAWHIRSMLGVPMVLRGEVIGILFVDNEGQFHRFSPSVCEIASTFADLAAVVISQARVTTELRSTIATVARQNKLLRQAAAVEERLADLVLNGADLSELAAAVTELTAKPTSIHDAKHRRLATAVPPSLGGEVLPRLLEAPYRSDPSVVEALDGLAARGGVIGPLPNAGLHHRFLIAPVVMRDEVFGHVVIMECRSRFGPLDLHIARRAATKVALELAIERRAVAADSDARMSLTADLICGRLDSVSLGRRARHLGIDPTASRVLCLVCGEAAAGDGVPPFDEVSMSLASMAAGDGVLATSVAEGAVALLELNPELATLEAIADVRKGVERTLEKFGETRLRAAISSRCALPPDYARAYDEAQQVMTCLRSLSQNPALRVLAADDLGAGRVLLASSDRTTVMRFAQDALGALLEDDDGMRDLLRTLRTFFDSARSVRRSAVRLGVHENTIRYRLARIESATGLAVSSSSGDQFTAQLALLVLRLGGALPSNDAEPPDPAPW